MLIPIEILQGDSARIVIPITKNSRPVSLTQATDAKLIIEDAAGNRRAQYSYIPTDGYGTLAIPFSSEYFIELRIERSESKLFPPGPLFFIIIIQFVDENMTSGLRYETFKFHGINVKKSSALSEF